MAKQTFDIQQHVTDSIIEAMETGCPPWRQPWTGSKAGAAFPLRANGEAYRGINVLMLWLIAGQKGFASPFWFTFKQAQEAGGMVRKGENPPVLSFTTPSKKKTK